MFSAKENQLIIGPVKLQISSTPRMALAAQAVLILEKNCHFHRLIQKLGRLKRTFMDMGELMDVLTRYVESDTIKDPNQDDDHTNKGKMNGWQRSAEE